MKLNEKLTGFLNQKKNLNDQNCIATKILKLAEEQGINIDLNDG